MVGYCIRKSGVTEKYVGVVQEKHFFSLSIYINLATVKSIALLHQYAVNVDFMMQWL